MNAFSHVKKFAQNHAFDLGVATGFVVGMVLMSRIPSSGMIRRVALTPEQLKSLIEQPESVASFSFTPRDIVWVINSTTKEVFP